MNAAIPENYKNLSAIARSTGKELRSWINRKTGKDAIVKFNESHPDIENPVITIRGRGKEQGTWAHPELAAVFASWCDPNFTAEVVAQNAHLKEQNALLREKIATFRPNTPVDVMEVLDEVGEVKRLAQQAEEQTEEVVELIARTHFAAHPSYHPKGMTFDKYLPHWIHAHIGRGIYPVDVMEAIHKRVGDPTPSDGKVLKKGYTVVWIEA